MPIRGFPDRGVVACFNEPNQSGSIDDWNAPRNAPIKDPLNNIQNVVWHSDFFQYELAVPIQTITITHQALATMSKTFSYGYTITFHGDMVGRDIILYNHNLGYTPLAFVLVDGKTLVPNTLIQFAQLGQGGYSRNITSYSDNNSVGIREVVYSGTSPAPSISKTYQVMIFREPLADFSAPLFGKNDDGVVSLAHNKVRTDRQYVRQIEGSESGFVIDLDETVDISNGKSRIISGSNITDEYGYKGSFLGNPFTRIGL